jgi:cation transport regulator ChaC
MNDVSSLGCSGSHFFLPIPLADMINLLTLNGIFHLLVLSFQHLSTSPETMRQRQFVFAYGSLINPESRAITNPSLADQEALPVMVSNVERVWSARTISGYTAMGVRFREGAECSGVLLEVNAEELADLDEREKNYIRLEIHLDNVDQVPFLPDDVFYENEKADIIFDAKEKQRNNVKVWVYVQKEPIPADASHPIPQSYGESQEYDSAWFVISLFP